MNIKPFAYGLLSGVLSTYGLFYYFSGQGLPEQPEKRPEPKIEVIKSQKKIVIELNEGNRKLLSYFHRDDPRYNALEITEKQLWIEDWEPRDNPDGIPDKVVSYKYVNGVYVSYTYNRGGPDTDILFQRVEELWNKYRKELDVERRIKEELAKPAPRPESILE